MCSPAQKPSKSHYLRFFEADGNGKNTYERKRSHLGKGS
jgi:hypothetical protein